MKSPPVERGPSEGLKVDVREFWNRASCGGELLLPSTDGDGYLAQTRARYDLEPYTRGFAKFSESQGLLVLEIGVGLGADH